MTRPAVLHIIPSLVTGGADHMLASLVTAKRAAPYPQALINLMAEGVYSDVATERRPRQSDEGSWHFSAGGRGVAAYRITNPARVPPNWCGMMEIRGVLFGAGQMLLLFAIASSLDKFFLPRFVSAADYGIYVAIGQLAIGQYRLNWLSPSVAPY